MKNAKRYLSGLLVATMLLFTMPVTAAAAVLIDYKVTYTDTKVKLTLTAQSEDNTIYFTTDGSKPTTASRVYTKKLSASRQVVIRAIELDGDGQRVASLKITIKPRVQSVSIDTDNVDSDGNRYISLSTATADAVIRFTTDGSTPTETSQQFYGALYINEPCTLKVRAFKDGMKASKVTSCEITDSRTQAYIDEVIRLVNVEREKAGLDPLTKNETLCKAAAVRAQELVSERSHTRPDGSSCFTIYKEFGLHYLSAGENVAAGQNTPAKVVRSWMNSEGHRANILSDKFSQIGVGYYYDGSTPYAYYWGQLFMD